MSSTEPEPKHCPNPECNDQGWYPEGRMVTHPIYGENGEPVGANVDIDWEQVQCQWCWETPDSVFNINRKEQHP